MQENAQYGKRFGDALKPQHVKLMTTAGMLALMVGSASAAMDLNGTIGPILDSVTELIPSIVNLIVSIVPAIITLAVIGFIIGFFDKILGMMKL